MAGSKPGERRGGRQKGTPNKRTTVTHEEIRSGGEMPLERLLKRMRDPQVEDHVRDDLAVKAAPYCHSRAPQLTEVSGRDGAAIDMNVTLTPHQRLRRINTLFRTAATEDE